MVIVRGFPLGPTLFTLSLNRVIVTELTPYGTNVKVVLSEGRLNVVNLSTMLNVAVTEVSTTLNMPVDPRSRSLVVSETFYDRYQ